MRDPRRLLPDPIPPSQMLPELIQLCGGLGRFVEVYSARRISKNVGRSSDFSRLSTVVCFLHPPNQNHQARLASSPTIILPLTMVVQRDVGLSKDNNNLINLRGLRVHCADYSYKSMKILEEEFGKLITCIEGPL